MKYKCYNNGIVNRYVYEGETVPEGFILGKLGKPWNKGLTKSTNETLQTVSRKVSAATQGRAAWNKGRPASEQQKLKQSAKMKGRTAWNKGLTKDTDSRVLQTSIKLTGHPFNTPPERLAEAKRKEYITKKRNKSFNTSKPELELYEELVSQYGEDNVVCQYDTDSRYPFPCDFYIKSEDLFIEYNGTFDHGEHPFDPTNEDDLAELARLHKLVEEKGNTSRYNNVIKVWTIRDPLKLKTMKDNHLNFKVIYPNITITR